MKTKRMDRLKSSLIGVGILTFAFVGLFYPAYLVYLLEALMVALFVATFYILI